LKRARDGRGGREPQGKKWKWDRAKTIIWKAKRGPGHPGPSPGFGGKAEGKLKRTETPRRKKRRFIG